jgi:UDP-2,4-diacetamido-2,4,6-trideoxy-beta-L-altropyranose hydrolase
MQVVIRTDASIQIGTGHVMRCLTLADRLRQKGASVNFVCREHAGHLCELIHQQGYTVLRLPFSLQTTSQMNEKKTYEHWLGDTWEADADQTTDIISRACDHIDLLIVDHYAIDIRWEQRIRRFVKKIMVIDDLANRPHDCDILLDQNLYDNMGDRYRGLVSEHCIKLLGPRYALLREEFQAARTNAKVKNGAVQRILVFFGGSDPTNETKKALEAITSLKRMDITIDVVVGMSNSHKDQIASLCSKMPNTNFYCQIDHIAELMAKADLALGAGGATTWERCFLGLPAITITTADNQIEITEAAAKAGAIIYLGHYSEISPRVMAEALSQLLQSPESLSRMSNAGMEIMGELQGGAVAVAELLHSEMKNKQVI